MFLDILLGSKATWRILTLMSESPGSRITRAEIKKCTKLGNNAISESIKDLVCHKILTMQKRGRKEYYQIDLTNELAKKIIDICDLERKANNNLPYQYSLILREYVRLVLSVFVPQRIILFGSVAKRTFREDSDIDVALIFMSKLPMQKKLDLEEITHKLRKRFQKNIQQHIFTEKEFNKSKSALTDDIKRDGVELI